MTYLPHESRYDTMLYRRCGRSGLDHRLDRMLRHDIEAHLDSDVCV